MGILDKHLGKSKGSNHDDVLTGGSRNDHIDGRGGDDQIFGLGGDDKLKGGSGNDVLHGGNGNDVLYGNSGKDVLLGGAGNDILYGDDKGHDHFSSWFWCKPSGYADYLDGGSGNDKVYGAGGNDFANYTMAENLGARDFYDGGRGTDTLQLSLTWGEFALTSVQQDISRFELFLDRHGNSGKDNGQTFQFASFDLDARNFEDLVVKLVNTGPDAVNDTGATNEDAVLNVAKASGLLKNDTDPDHLDVLTVDFFSGTSAMGAAVVVNADGSYKYDPTGAAALQALKAGQTASDTFSYTVHDLAGATDTATVTIAVTGVNDAPIAIIDEYSLDEDTILTLSGPGLLANDSDPDSGSTLTALLVSGPTHGALVLNANGSFTYIPEANFNGTDGFVYRANDGLALSGTASVTLNVNPVNDAPVASDDTYTLDEDTVLTLDVLDNDTDVDGDTLATVIFEGAAHGMVTAGVDGSFIYTPDADFYGTDSFQYRSNDGNLPSGIATVSITVNPVNDAPVARADSAGTDEDTVLTGSVLGNDSDVEGDALIVTTTGTMTLASGATVSLAADGTYSYDPRTSTILQALDAGQSMTDSFGYTISDGNGGTSSATVDINVTGLAEPTTDTGQILDSVAPGTELEYIVRFNNGEWLELDGFTLGFQNSVSTSGGGGGAGKSSADDATLLLGSSGQLTQLTGSLLAGQHLENVEIEVYAAGSKDQKQLVDEFNFNDVLLSKLDSGNSLNNALSFEFKSFTHGHVEFDQNDGSVESEAVTGWDFGLNVAIDDAPLPSADGSKALPDEQVSPQNLEYYVLFDGADGWLRVDSFSLGLQNSGSSTIGGGAGTGKSTATDVSLLLGSSTELLDLTTALASGVHLKNVEIEAYATGGKDQMQLIDEFKFSDVLITQLDTTNASSNVLNFDFSSFTHGHVAIDPNDGSVTGYTGAGWDFVNNVEEPPLNPDADFGKNLPEDSVAPGTELEYIVRFNNGEWLELDGFTLGFQNSVSTSGGGGGAGKSSADDATLLLGSSGQLTQLTGSLLAGQHLENVEIEVYAAGSKDQKQLVDEFNFNDVLLSKLDSGNSLNNALSFEFKSFTHGHVEFDQNDGSVESEAATGWDFGLNVAIDDAPLPSADGSKALPDEQVSPQNLEYYVLFDGADGWLRVDSFSLGLQNSGSSTIGGGAGTGKSTATDVSLLLGSSTELLDLTTALASGVHLKNVEIEAYATGGKDQMQLIDEFKFSDVLITQLDTTNASSNVLNFDFSSFTHGHVAIDPNDGSVTGYTGAGWDFANNVEEPPLNPDADFGKNLPEDSVAPGTELEYIVRFNNGEWLELDGFTLGFQNSVSTSGGGGGAGKSSADDATLLLGSSGQLTQLTGSLLAGQHLENVEIEVYAAGSKDQKQLVDEFNFNDVLLSKLDSGNSLNNALSFEFKSFTHGHVEFDQNDGSVESEAATGWDFGLNVAIDDAPLPSADGSKALPDEQVSPQNLEYYVLFDGADGWLRVDSFSLGLQNSGSSTIGGGAGTGKSTATDVSLLLGSSTELLDLTTALASGAHLKNVEIEAYATGGKDQMQLIDEFKFSDVLITQLDTTNASSNVLNFDFSSFTHGHVAIDPNDGSVTGYTGAGWDFANNVEEPPLNPDADLFA